MNRVAAAVLTLCTAAGWLAVGQAQPRDLVFTQVTVRSSSGEPVLGLTQGDFEITSDGVPTPVAHLTGAPTAVTGAMLLDVSTSMSWRHPAASVRAGFDGFIAGLSPGDRFGITPFGGPPPGAAAGQLTADRPLLSAAVRDALRIRQFGPGGPSPVWDAVDSAVAQLATEDGRRVIVLITDGRSTGNRHALADVIARAMNADVAVTVLYQGSSYGITVNDGSGLRVAPDVFLERLAEQTGGAYFADAPRLGDGGNQSPEQLFRRILDTLHSAYVIGFAAPPPGPAPRRLTLRVKREGVKAHARQMYWYRQ